MENMPGIRQVPRTGVIYVMHEAGKRGFVYGHPDWANLGQGSPESGDLPGAPPRVESIKLTPAHFLPQTMEPVVAALYVLPASAPIAAADETRVATHLDCCAIRASEFIDRWME